MGILGYLKYVLDSEASLLIDNEKELTDETNKQKGILDCRMGCVNRIFDCVMDANFLSTLIETISIYINELYNREVDLSKVIITDSCGEVLEVDASESDSCKLEEANQKLAKQLFDKVVDILESHKDIVLDIETIKRLLNRNPKELTFLVKSDYVCRSFAFHKLAKVLGENETLKKSNIGIEDVYQLLFDTCQTNQEDVFANLISAEAFKESHKKIDELLLHCNAKTFVEIINIVRNSFDENYDVLNILKQRNKGNFCEAVIVEILARYHTDDDIDLIHSMLTDDSIQINYSYECLSCYGQSINLITSIATSNNRILISDLLSRDSNVRSRYSDEVSVAYLYNLYAIIGQYDKALSAFIESYDYKNDFNDATNGELTEETPAYGDDGYKDSLVEFIRIIIDSCRTDEVEYKDVKSIIERILMAENVEVINLAVILPILKAVLEDADYETLFVALMKKHNFGDLRFTVVEEADGDYGKYEIRVVTDEEFKKCMSDLNKSPNKGLELK